MERVKSTIVVSPLSIRFAVRSPRAIRLVEVFRYSCKYSDELVPYDKRMLLELMLRQTRRIDSCSACRRNSDNLNARAILRSADRPNVSTHIRRFLPR